MPLDKQEKKRRICQWIDNNGPAGQSQESLRHQLEQLMYIANLLGLYDAHDFISSQLDHFKRWNVKPELS